MLYKHAQVFIYIYRICGMFFIPKGAIIIIHVLMLFQLLSMINTEHKSV